MYKSALAIPPEIFRKEMQIRGRIVTAPSRAKGTLRFKHRPIGGTFLRGLLSSPFSSSSDEDNIENTIQLRPFGVDLSGASSRKGPGSHAVSFVQKELVDTNKIVTLTPLCLATLDGDLVEPGVDAVDEEVICICKIHARVGASNFLGRLVNFRPYVDVGHLLLTRGLATCQEEDQRVMLSGGGLSAMDALMLAEREARTAGLGLWDEQDEEVTHQSFLRRLLGS